MLFKSILTIGRLLRGSTWFPAKSRIEHLILHLTDRCNLDCQHCFTLSNREGTDLSFREIEDIAATISRPIWLDIGGGEPFLREDLPEICGLFNAERIVIPTNGWMTDRIYITVKRLAKKKTSKIVIALSLDGFRQTHDEVRGRGSYDRAIKTYELLKNIREIRVGITTTLSNKNSAEVVNFLREMKKYEPDFHGVILLRGEPYNSSYSLPQIEELYQVEKEISGIIRANTHGGGLRGAIERNFVSYRRKIAFKTLKERRQVLPCLAGQAHLAIYSNGSVHPCEMLPSVGNIREKPLAEIIEGDALARSIDNIRAGSCYCTHECNMLDSILLNPSYYYHLVKYTKW